jgi:AcrR family transcriptional regulator
MQQVTTRPKRRTQAERSAAMQEKVLDAALDCLVELGFSGATTTAVAERAGVSRGAQLHHYPTRAELVAAAVQHLYRRLTADYQRGFARIAPKEDRLTAAIDLLWSMFTRTHYTAVLELFVAARTDAELRALLRPIAERHEANVFVLAREYFPEASASSAFDATLSLVLDSMQGMAVARCVYGRGADERSRLNAIRDLAARVLVAGAEEKP